MSLPRNSAARGIAVLILGLALAALLNAEGLRKQAEIQPQGVQRRLALRLTRPLVDVSRTLHLTTPRHDLQIAIGRENEDVIDTGVHLALPPPAATRPRARRRRHGAPCATGEAGVHGRASAARVGRRRLARAGAGRGARAGLGRLARVLPSRADCRRARAARSLQLVHAVPAGDRPAASERGRALVRRRRRAQLPDRRPRRTHRRPARKPVRGTPSTGAASTASRAS